MRVMVYYSASTNTNFDNALIGCMSFRRDGQGWYNCVVAAPPNGYKYLYPSACSDGVFNNAFSYMHVVFVEYYNNNNFTDTLHHSRTIDWGRTHASSKYHTPFSNPQFPSAAMKAYFNYEDDTIYVAVRNYNVISFSNITIMKTTGTPSNNWSNITTYPPGVSTGIKPKLTIVQQNIPPNQKKMFLTFLVTISDTGTGKGAYAYSLGGTSWSAMQYFTSSIIKFANCSSDTNTSSADYIMVAYSNSGDSLMTRRGSYAVLNSPVKVNSSMLSINSFPAPVIYTVGTTKYSSVLYAGQGNFRAYFDGENLITQIKKISAETPDKYFLSQNYPNPFNPVTFINYQLAKSSNVNLKVFDIIGKEIIELINEKQDAGTYEVSFDGTNIPSGIYFYKLTTNEFIKTRKMILVK